MRSFPNAARATMISAASTIFAIINAPSHAGGGEGCRQASLADLVRDCVGEDGQKTAEAIAQLRNAGQEGLDALCDEHDRLVDAHVPGGPQVLDMIAASAREGDPQIARLRHAIDAVAKQRDAYASRLYWYTDLGEARAKATASCKPILSLRMLGNLDEDLSCANSRFFRSILYANREVSNYLREHFILHWESLRPVPKLTIDFGDGRRIERTITGNSIHYVLDSNGEIIDALPGLYGPAAFLRCVQTAEAAAKTAATLSDADDDARLKFMRDYHWKSAAAIDQRLRDDLAKLTALDEAAGKGSESLNISIDAWRSNPPDDIVARLAGLPNDDQNFDQGSIAMIRSKVPADFLKVAEDAQKLTTSKRGPEAPVVAIFRTLHRTIAEDTVRNEYAIHYRIHHMLVDTPADQGDGLAAFNRRVYADLFLTPLDDPWMGLAPRDAYAAIDNGGLIDECLGN